MPIEYRKNLAVLTDNVTVEEAEGLLGWVQERPEARVDLAGCQHLHTAVLQVLMAADLRVTAWPADAELTAWLRTVLRDRQAA
ncbi:hypothetical protein [Ideonella livida]|uniref:STAS domain-containing protein n=1 Tax=Ideonella livida TaxID=2707176 RepID=A0A7C9PGL3_9BURK|nr:hypothetical protein [Ideonella livida]NDY90494.1 hypothetical protein [Ideonella livida]